MIYNFEMVDEKHPEVRENFRRVEFLSRVKRETFRAKFNMMSKNKEIPNKSVLTESAMLTEYLKLFIKKGEEESCYLRFFE